MKLFKRLWPLFVAVGMVSSAYAEVVEVPNGDDTVQIYWATVPTPKGTFLMFPGGEGGLALDANHEPSSRNFLVRTRELWRSRGYNVALFGNEVDRNERNSKEHVEEIKQALHWIEAQSNAPIYLVGTSRGTLSAAKAAESLDDAHIKGVVLTSPMAIIGGFFTSYDLKNFAKSVLVVSHRDDACRVTPASGGKGILSSAKASPRKEFIVVEGGTSTGNPCQALAFHGFNGIEPMVVNKVIDWIEAK